jgi:hypothetical protein
VPSGKRNNLRIGTSDAEVRPRSRGETSYLLVAHQTLGSYLRPGGSDLVPPSATSNGAPISRTKIKANPIRGPSSNRVALVSDLVPVDPRLRAAEQSP